MGGVQLHQIAISNEHFTMSPSAPTDCYLKTGVVTYHDSKFKPSTLGIVCIIE